jgi:predicted ATPase
MILQTVRVQNYKCIEDSTAFSLAQVTALVGKNESGKSAVLEALYKLNPIVEAAGTFDEVEQYPRREFADYEEAVRADPKKRANILTTVWALTDEEQKLLHDKLGEAAKVNTVTIQKGYDNTQHWIFPQDDKLAVQAVLAASGLPDAEKASFNSLPTIKDLTAALVAIATPSPAQASFRTKLQADFPEGSIGKAVLAILAPRLPKFVYFSQYDSLPGQVQLEGLQQRQAQGAAALTVEDQMFLAFLQQAGTQLNDIVGSTKFEHFVSRLEAVSNRISREIFEYWSQNRHLLVEFRLDTGRAQDSPPFNSGSIFRIRIRNTRHGVTVGFDNRSAGFVWFFSFLVWFSQARRNYGERLIILLDEPGLSLHARAQADLLRYFDEKLRPHYQVIYTTHSPFMIDPAHLLSVRTVEDVVKDDKPLGTKVGDEVLSTDRDTIFPLQAALGYDVTQTLFVGKYTVLVEGPGDLLYFQAFSHALRSRGRSGLDSRWVIAPTGGVDKIASFMALFGANKLDVAVFTDIHEGLKKKVKELRESTLLKKGRVFSADMYALQGEADIEDLIGREVYSALVNRCYGLSGTQALPESYPPGTSTRVVKDVEGHFAVLSPTAPQFDHYAPAIFLLEHGAEFFGSSPSVDAALDRFEMLFKDLNGLLPSDK